MSFKNDERGRQVAWKSSTPTLTNVAREPGTYTGKPSASGRARTREDFFLGDGCSSENLHPAIRDVSLHAFRSAGISWHDGPTAGEPSNYLMDSMVSCVNCLMPVARDGRALAALLRPVFPDAIDAATIVGDRVVAFEWLGRANHLDERNPNRGPGRFGTSADAYCVLVGADGRRRGVLIEWKYTETYEVGVVKPNRHYDSFFIDSNGPLRLAELGLDARAIRFDPFYQLARLSILAHRMELAGEDGVHEMHTLWVVPSENAALRTTMTAPALASLFPGNDVARAFRELLRTPARFHLTSPASLLNGFPDEEFPALASIVSDVRERYAKGRRNVEGFDGGTDAHLSTRF